MVINTQKGHIIMPGVLKDSSSRARALARQRDTEISRNAFLGISFFFFKSAHSIFLRLSPTIKGEIKQGGRKTMKTMRKYFYLDDFEHRLLVGCLMTARNEYIHENKSIEDVNELILKIIDAPSKKLRVIAKAEA